MISAVALSVLQPWLTQRIGEVRTLQVSFLVMAVFYMLFSFLDDSSWLLAFVIIVLFSVSSIAYPLAVGMATREVEAAEQGRLQGAVSILETTGKIVAPLLASDCLI